MKFIVALDFAIFLCPRNAPEPLNDSNYFISSKQSNLLNYIDNSAEKERKINQEIKADYELKIIEKSKCLDRFF